LLAKSLSNPLINTLIFPLRFNIVDISVKKSSVSSNLFDKRADEIINKASEIKLLEIFAQDTFVEQCYGDRIFISYNFFGSCNR
jgi:hypothetical protein